MLIYVSGPYRADTAEGIQANIDRAAAVAADLWKLGHVAICPHLNTTAPAMQSIEFEPQDWIKGDLDIVVRCDALVMVPGWEQSDGANQEKLYAESLGIPIYHAPHYPAMHPTEMRCPEQAKAFREYVGRMYRKHLSKNKDYSPANILIPGEIGLVTRTFDKVARLLNLTGFRFEVKEPGTYTKPDAPDNESIEDTYMDLAVYGIIGLILRERKWGK